jgi:hypothetical protein
MTEDRIVALNGLGFAWNSHEGKYITNNNLHLHPENHSRDSPSFLCFFNVSNDEIVCSRLGGTT